MPYIQCNGANLYYEDKGEGPPIVFIHGAIAGLRFFEPQLTGLSNEYRTVAFDYRGHGRSSKTEQGHTVPQYAHDLHAFLEQRCLDDVVLVGWSLGALVSWEYVDQFGTGRLRAMVDVDMEASRFQWEDYEHGTTNLEALTALLFRVQTDHLSLIEQITERILKDLPSAEMRTLIFDELSRTPPLVMSAILFDCTMRDYRNVLPTVNVPTLVCAGVDEKWRTVAAVKHVAELIPDARFELFKESGHCLTIEEPERFNQVVKNFVESL